MEARLTDLAAVLGLAADLAHGAVPEHQLRVAVVAARAADRLELRPDERRDAFDAALLRWLGCSAIAHPLSRWMGDEIEAHRRAGFFRRPLDPLVEGLRHTGAGQPVVQRVGLVLGFLREGPAVLFGSACEVGAELAARLDYGPPVVHALAHAFERYDGKGWPGELRGAEITTAAGLAYAAEELVGNADAEGLDAACRLVRERAGSAHDPEVAAAVLAVAPAAYAELTAGDALALALDADPEPLRAVGLGQALEVVADFVDLKMPSRSGHSRAVAELAADAAAVLGLADGAEVRAAGLVHDLGRVGVPNPVWERAAPLSSAEREQVHACGEVTRRLTGRVAWLAPAGRLAAQAHERLDGSGHPHGLSGAALPMPARVLQAADHLRGLTEERTYRPALSRTDAVARLRSAAQEGRFDPGAVEAVVEAAGGRPRVRQSRPDGLTAREVEVLGLVARGLSNAGIADRLVLSRRTVDHHVAHIYAKAGVATRAGAALYAMQHHLVDPAEGSGR